MNDVNTMELWEHCMTGVVLLCFHMNTLCVVLDEGWNNTWFSDAFGKIACYVPNIPEWRRMA